MQETQDEEYIFAREERGEVICLEGGSFEVQRGPQKLELVHQKTGRDGDQVVNYQERLHSPAFLAVKFGHMTNFWTVGYK